MTFTRFLLATACLYAVNALADDFQDFRIPRHHVMSLSASADGWYSTHLYRPLGGREDGSYWSGSAAGDFFHLTESDHYLSQFRFSGDVYGRSEGLKSRRTTSDTSQTRGHNDRKYVNERLYGAWQGRAYPWEIPLGVQLSVNGNAYWDQRWESQTWTDRYPASQYTSVTEGENWYYHYSVSSSAMAGWGRVRDASGIYQARVMEQRLIKSGVLSGELQPGTIQHLAQLIYRQGDFYYQHERSERFYWRELEEILRGDPTFQAERFDAYNVFLSGDPIFPNSYSYRPSGYFFGPVAEVRHTNDIARYSHLRTDSNGDTLDYGSDHATQHYDQVMAGLSASYYRPFGLNWQLSASSSFLVPVRPDEEKENRLRWNTRVYLAYLIADRWLAATDFYHSRTVLSYPQNYYGSASTNNAWTAGARAQVAYYVEDHWNVYTAVDYDSRGWADRNYGYDDRRADVRDVTFRVGLSHAFIGSGASGGFYF